MTHDLAIILSLIALALTGIDWLQTVYIARHPARFFERNPILGMHPSVRQVNAYFAFCGALALVFAALCLYAELDGVLVAAALILLAVELYWVVNNHRLGIKLGWQE
jgi:hypothetical protein